MSSLTRLGGEDITKIKTLQSTINTLTDNNTSLNTEINNGKTSIATAITNKGVETSSSSSFDTMATNIGNINAGSTFSKYKKVQLTFASNVNRDGYVSGKINLDFKPTRIYLHVGMAIEPNTNMGMRWFTSTRESNGKVLWSANSGTGCGAGSITFGNNYISLNGVYAAETFAGTHTVNTVYFTEDTFYIEIYGEA